MFLTSIVGALALTNVALAKVHMVQVAPGDDLVFSPNVIKAAKGDQIQFNFPGGNEHSVTQGDFDNACQPSDDSDAWFSGFAPEGPWTVTIDEEGDSYPFYCSSPEGHCQAGMVGVINPTGDDTLAAYKKAASKTTSSGSPSKVQGGVFKAANAAKGGSGASSSSSAAAMATNGAGQLVMNSVAGTIPLGVAAYVLL